MKSKFNINWKRSIQPRKQRKYLANAPNHLRHKEMSSTLDKPLRKKYGIRSIEVRKDDEIIVMRGKYKNKKAKISKVNISKKKVQLDGVNLQKKDGEGTNLWFYPSNLKIVKLEDSDSKRLKNLKKTLEKKEVGSSSKEEKINKEIKEDAY